MLINMDKKLLLYIFTLILLLISINYFYRVIRFEPPSYRPDVKIYTEESLIPSIKVQHKWINSNTQNSYLSPHTWQAASSLESKILNSGKTLTIAFSYKPKQMIIKTYSNGKISADSSISFGSKLTYDFVLPSDKGDYLFEILGYWDSNHNTSDLFKITIQ